MAKVIINESDNTQQIIDSSITDIVYVPGFIGSGYDQVNKLPYNTPTLFTTLSDFKARVGTSAAIINDKTYEQLQTAEGDTSAFVAQFAPTEYQIATDYVITQAQTSSEQNHQFKDLGYIYAFDLLSAGIPVYFEAIKPYDESNITLSDFYRAIAGYSLNVIYDIDEYSSSSSYDVGDLCVRSSYSYTGTTTVSSGSLTFTIPSDPTVRQSVMGVHTYTYNGTNWVENDQTVTLSSIGITLTGTPVQGNTITAKAAAISIKYYTCTTEISSGETWNESHWQEMKEIDIPRDKWEISGLTPTDSILTKISSLGTYNIKYITSGGYPIFNARTCQNGTNGANNPFIDQLFINVAEASSVTSEETSRRGDCVALIDHTLYPQRPLSATNVNSVYGTLNSQSQGHYISSSFAAMFTPWGSYSNGYDLPASYAYLTSLAQSIANYNSYYAVAGVIRGHVNKLNYLLVDEQLTQSIANSYQASEGNISINAITFINGYGNTIWGNRTMQGGAVSALSYLNIRNMVSDIRKAAYNSGMRYLFEQNNDVLWVNFKASLAPYLEKLRTSDGIRDYTIARLQTNEKAKLACQITMYPVYAVEEIEVNINLQDEVTVSEE